MVMLQPCAHTACKHEQGPLSQAVERAVKLVEERKARPVDSKEASKGRVEFVKVGAQGRLQPMVLHFPRASAGTGASQSWPRLIKLTLRTSLPLLFMLPQVRNWGTGDPGDLGQLEVEAASQVHLDSSAPLYEQLAKRLELLEASPLPSC